MKLKKDRGRFTVRFDMENPDHVRAVEYLERQRDRGKAQYLADAILCYTITVRMLCRCNASAAKNFQGSASGAILILWRIGIIMQKKAKKRNHRFYG